MRIGLFGGTFDPIHCGHLDVARAARAALSLSELWLVPSRVPPHRSSPSVSAAHRFAMAAVAIADEGGLRLSDIEMEVPGPSYTIETLDRFAALRRVPADRLYFVTGADAFRDIGSWKAYPGVLDRCHFIVISRPGFSSAAVRQALPDLASRFADPGDRPRSTPGIFLVDAPTAAVSSTEVRRAAAEGKSLEGLVPARVADYIGRQGLYGAGLATEAPHG